MEPEEEIFLNSVSIEILNHNIVIKTTYKHINYVDYKELIILNVFPAFDCRKDGEPNGFFPDPEQCDLYYECVDGVATPTLCPDGLMFDDRSSIEAKCDYPFNTDCGVREYVRK